MTNGGAMGRPKKTWSVTVGAYGHQVTAYERTLGGPLWLRWWNPGASGEPGRKAYRGLRHTDRAAAEAGAREIAGQLVASTLAAAKSRATVAEVFAIYEHDVAKHLKGQGPKEAKRRMAIWTHFLGANRDVTTIDFPTLQRYVRERRAGAIKLEPFKLAAEPSNRAIGADFTLLQAALNHATRVTRSNGVRLLASNPVAGFEAPRNRTVKRPVATYDRFLSIVEHANGVDPQRLFGAFMELIEGLGWRVSAVCSLRARDVERKPSPHAPNGRIFKRADVDKEGESAWVPMSGAVRAAVDRVLAANPAIGDWPLFPAPKAKMSAAKDAIPKCWSRHHVRALLERAEDKAEVGHLDGSDFHAYRRKWATERKHLPARDVASAGQWRDLRTLETAYTHADEQTMLTVVSEPRKLRAVNEKNIPEGS